MIDQRDPCSSPSPPWRRGLACAAVLVAALLYCVVAAAGDKPLEARLQHLDGGKVKLSELRGSPMLLELWATWCLPCAEQKRIVEELREVFAERGIEVYALNVGEDPDVVQPFLEERPSAYPVLLDRLQVIATRLGIAELPSLILLRADGTVAGTTLGLVESEKLLSLLDKLDATD